MSTSEDILKEAIPIVIMMLAGYLGARFRPRVFSMQTLAGLNRFVYNVAIPCTVFKGLAIRDLVDLDWMFVLLFIVIRAVSAVAVVGALVALRAYGRNDTRRSQWDFLGDFLLNWIGTTWINTIIFGIPMLVSLYGPRVSILNILAAMGSLIFQMPIMLVLFEYRAFQQDEAAEERQKKLADSHFVENGGIVAETAASARDGITFVTVPMTVSQSATGSGNDAEELVRRSSSYVLATSSADPSNGRDAAKLPRTRATQPRASRWRLAWRLAVRLVSNPPMAGILLGLGYSLILRTAIDEQRFPYWIDKWVTYFGNTVTPLAAFSIGMFMVGREGYFLATARHSLVLMVVKFVLLPLLTLGFAHALGIDGIEGRSAVLIASLPIAVASFSISQKYFAHSDEDGKGSPATGSDRCHHPHPPRWATTPSAEEDTASVVIAGQVIVGSLLMAPVFLAWNAILEKLEVFGDFGDVAYTG
eukprot:m.300312 g.300312  ORF g.300312 m.300312 type:complete len:474 (-) comp14418_c0_seq1:97-1518(-)